MEKIFTIVPLLSYPGPGVRVKALAASGWGEKKEGTKAGFAMGSWFVWQRPPAGLHRTDWWYPAEQEKPEVWLLKRKGGPEAAS